MPIAGVVVLSSKNDIQRVYENLQKHPQITTYGIHQEQYVVAVVETAPGEDMEQLLNQIQEQEPSILGIYPAYINFEDEVFDQANNEN